MREHRGLDAAQLRPGLEPQLFAEDVASLLEDAQGVGLPPGPVQRHHQQSARSLAQRMFGHQAFELDDRTQVATEPELDVEPLLDRGEAQLRQAA